MRARATSQAGFSLVELMVAMVITLIVTGAIYGLMSSGQSAFRRDPEITERQQNIRVAMDLIQRDIATAGMGMTPFMQSFTHVDTLLSVLDGAGPVAPSGANSDYLEIFGNDGACPPVTVCNNAGVNLMFNEQPLPACYNNVLPGPVVVVPGFTNDSYELGFAWNPVDIPLGGCAGGKVNFPPGQGPPAWNDPPGTYSSTPARMQIIQIVRYEIHYRRPGGDGLLNTPDDVISPAFAADGIPELWRSASGGLDPNILYAAPSQPPPPGWGVVASGIDDLQVQYSNANNPGPDGVLFTADDVWLDRPGIVNPDLPDPPAPGTPTPWPPSNFGTIIQQVRVTLSARTLATNIAGATQGAAGPAAIRGQLVSVTTPRAALFSISKPDPQTGKDPGVLTWR